MSDVDSRNETARRRAQKAGRCTYTYQQEVVLLAPACVECGQQLGGPFLSSRSCDCPGVVWRESYGVAGQEWTRETTGEHVDV